MSKPGLEPTTHPQRAGLQKVAAEKLFAVIIPKLVAVEVFETSNPAYEAFIYPDSPRFKLAFLVDVRHCYTNESVTSLPYRMTG